MRAVGGAHNSEDGGIFAFRQRYFTASRNPAVPMPAFNGSFKNKLTPTPDRALRGAAAALPLNALVGLNVNQPVVLEIDRSGVAAELKQLFDVVLYLEYIASF